MSTPNMVSPKDAAREVAWEKFYAQTAEGGAVNPSALERDLRIRHAIATSYGKTGFLVGFDGGVQWQRSQGDSLCRDLIGAVTEAIQMFEAVGGLRVSGGTKRIMEKRVQGWQRLIDTAEERA